MIRDYNHTLELLQVLLKNGFLVSSTKSVLNDSFGTWLSAELHVVVVSSRTLFINFIRKILIIIFWGRGPDTFY